MNHKGGFSATMEAGAHICRSEGLLGGDGAPEFDEGPGCASATHVARKKQGSQANFPRSWWNKSSEQTKTRDAPCRDPVFPFTNPAKDAVARFGVRVGREALLDLLSWL